MGQARERSSGVPRPPQHVVVPRVLVVSDDLMFGSKISEGLAAAGYEVRIAAEPEPDEGEELVIADLETVDHEALGALPQPVLGYYPHVSTEIRDSARRAGVSEVVPRSKLNRDLLILVSGLLPASQ